MKSSKRTVRYMANKFHLDPDELLVTLWYSGNKKHFSYLEKLDSIIRQNDLCLVNKAISFKKKSSDRNVNSWADILGYKDKRKFFKFLEREFGYSLGGNITEISEDLSNKLLNYLDIETSQKEASQIDNEIEIHRNFNFYESNYTALKDFLYLNKDDVLIIHRALVKDFENLNDSIYPPGVRDQQMLESAIFHPQTSFGGIFKYKAIESAAAAIMYSLCQNHCFHNGNKRTAIVSMLVFLDRHNIAIQCDEDELFKMALSLADHKLSVDEINSDAEIYAMYKWICQKSKILTKGERVITFKRLYQILNRFGCSINGNKVERIVVRESRFFGKRKKILKTSIRIVQAGYEVDIMLLKKIRKDLELDCDHNIDLDTFYYDAEYYACEFIEKYKNLLRRLARF